MLCTPVLRKKGPQRCNHARRVLAEVDITFCQPGNMYDQDIALFLQPGRVLNICDHVVEAIQHFAHPCTGTEAHHGGIEPKHFKVRCGDLVCRQGAALSL